MIGLIFLIAMVCFWILQLVVAIAERVWKGILLLSTVFALYILSVAMINTNYEYEVYKERSVYSLCSGSKMSGSFVLGTGSAGHRDYITYWESNGEYKTKAQIRAEKVRVYENSSEAKAIYKKVVPENKYIALIFDPINLLIDNRGEIVELHVPENTIYKEMSLK